MNTQPANHPTVSALEPRQPVPPLQVPTLDHGQFILSSDAPVNFTLLVFYRGLHCPICLKYLLELGRLQPEFEARAVKVVAVSYHPRDRAQATPTRSAHRPCAWSMTCLCPWRASGACTSALRAAPPPLAFKSRPCFQSRQCSSCGQTARCITAPCRPCAWSWTGCSGATLRARRTSSRYLRQPITRCGRCCTGSSPD